MVQVKTTVFSLMYLPVSTASVILGVGTAYHGRYDIKHEELMSRSNSYLTLVLCGID